MSITECNIKNTFCQSIINTPTVTDFTFSKVVFKEVDFQLDYIQNMQSFILNTNGYINLKYMVAINKIFTKQNTTNKQYDDIRLSHKLRDMMLYVASLPLVRNNPKEYKRIFTESQLDGIASMFFKDVSIYKKKYKHLVLTAFFEPIRTFNPTKNMYNYFFSLRALGNTPDGNSFHYYKDVSKIPCQSFLVSRFTPFENYKLLVVYHLLKMDEFKEMLYNYKMIESVYGLNREQIRDTLRIHNLAFKTKIVTKKEFRPISRYECDVVEGKPVTTKRFNKNNKVPIGFSLEYGETTITDLELFNGYNVDNQESLLRLRKRIILFKRYMDNDDIRNDSLDQPSKEEAIKQRVLFSQEQSIGKIKYYGIVFDYAHVYQVMRHVAYSLVKKDSYELSQYGFRKRDYKLKPLILNNSRISLGKLSKI